MYTTFAIVVTAQPPTRPGSPVYAHRWVVFRRYSAFRALYDALKSARFAVPSGFPGRQLVGLFKSDIVSRRQTGLQTWMARLVSNAPKALEEETILRFLLEGADEFPPTYSGPPLDDLFETADAHVLEHPKLWGECSIMIRDVLTEEVEKIEASTKTPTPTTTLKPSSSKTSSSSSRTSSSTVNVDSFDLLKVIGRGSFGKVLQVRKKDTGKVYAMKVLSKPNLVARKQVEHTKTERRVLGHTKFPFVVSLHYAFQTRDKLFFVLDFAAGGELFYHLGRMGTFPEEMAKFYTAELTLALGHLHRNGVVYRDLKPENILIDATGHIKLADFGLSKEGVHGAAEGAQSFCGTPEYLAPEILDKKGHGVAVDWWSLGMILFEQLTGLPPFYTKDRKRLYERIRSAELRFPSDVPMSREAKDLIRALLRRNPRERLGGGGGDASEVMAHPFFDNIDFELLLRRRVKPPFVPKVSSATDTACFEEEFTSQRVDTNIEGKGIPRDRRERLSSSVAPHFPGFTFENKSALARSASSEKMSLSASGGGLSPTPTTTRDGPVPRWGGPTHASAVGRTVSGASGSSPPFGEDLERAARLSFSKPA